MTYKTNYENEADLKRAGNTLWLIQKKKKTGKTTIITWMQSIHWAEYTHNECTKHKNRENIPTETNTHIHCVNFSVGMFSVF